MILPSFLQDRNDNINILAIDQARNGGWSIFDYETKKLIKYGHFEFSNKLYTYPQAILEIEKLIDELIKENDICACFIEDINLRRNVDAFKRLAQLQGVLVNYFEKNNILYGIVAATQWQNYCKARGRTEKEKKSNICELDVSNKKASKVLSIQYVSDVFNVQTNNDNIADAICQGAYAVNNIKIEIQGE